MKKSIYLSVIICLGLFTNLFSQSQNYYDVSAGDGKGVRFWNGSNNYKISMGNGAEYKYGPVTSYSINMRMNDDATRGFTWGVIGNAPKAALNTEGTLQLAKDLFVMGKISTGITSPKAKIHIAGIASSTVGGDGLMLSDDDVPTRAFLFRLDNDNKDLHIDNKYGGTWENIMTLKRGTGNLGLGLSPTGRLQIKGGGDPNVDKNGVAVYNSVANSVRASLSVTSSDHGIINLYNSASSLRATINSNGNTYFNGGNVGISVLSPQSKLHIAGIASSTIGGDGLMLSDDGTPTRAFLFRIDNDNKDFHIDNKYDATWSTSLTILRGSGRVGIGTSNPQSLLAVKGKITAQEIEVTLSGWSDFVFDKNYKLETLDEVENYIMENGHLPNVPSEEEVIKKGVNLGEMDAILLRKIEELTLYMIDMKKENEELKAELGKLTSK